MISNNAKQFTEVTRDNSNMGIEDVLNNIESLCSNISSEFLTDNIEGLKNNINNTRLRVKSI